VLTSGGTGQSGAAPDRHYSLFGAPLTSSLTSVVNCSAVMGTMQSTIAPKSRCSTVTSDSPVNYSGVTLEKPEGEEFGLVRSWLGMAMGRCGGQISPGSTGRIKDLTKGPRAQ
jgi:hypothetical protein